ncbi:MAG: ATP-binding cassette domain-containing protein, partial [bacterium]
MSVKQSILFTSNLFKSYPTAGGALEVLKGIDLTIYAGEIVAIVGPSGVGKSTLLHILGALDRPTSGEVQIDSAPVSTLDDRALAQL